jgi:hypothetical protein
MAAFFMLVLRLGVSPACFQSPFESTRMLWWSPSCFPHLLSLNRQVFGTLVFQIELWSISELATS